MHTALRVRQLLKVSDKCQRANLQYSYLHRVCIYIIFSAMDSI